MGAVLDQDEPPSVVKNAHPSLPCSSEGDAAMGIVVLGSLNGSCLLTETTKHPAQLLTAGSGGHTYSQLSALS